MSVSEILRDYMRCGKWHPKWELDAVGTRAGFIIPNVNFFLFWSNLVEQGPLGYRLRNLECRHRSCEARRVLED